MRFRHILPMTCTVGLLLLTGCSGKSASELTALAPYANATLTPGVGLGDLQLGRTTLGQFVNKVGSGLVVMSIGDETALELNFLNGEATFLFIVSGACQNETGGPGTRLETSQDVKTFLAQHPACNDLPLSSISVATRTSNQADTFFKGSTDRGVKLWAPKSEADKHGTVLNKPGQLVAGERDEGLDRLEYSGGIYFYYPAGEGPTPQEQRSGQALSPERLREIDAAAKEAAKNAVIKRMTIFVPSP